MRYFDEGLNGEGGQFIMRQVSGRAALPPYRTILAIGDDGAIVAGAVLNDYNGANVELTYWGDKRAMTAKGLAFLFQIIFGKRRGDLMCTRCTVHTKRGKAKRNPLVHGPRAILTRLGFVHEITSPRWYGNGQHNDALVFRMMREDCPWIAADGGYRQKSEGARPSGHSQRAKGSQPIDRDHPTTNGTGQPARA